MKNKVLFKIPNITVLCSLLLVSLACDKEADHRIDFYKSKNRGQELKGWGRSIDDASEDPHYMLLEDHLYKSVSYSDPQVYYIPAERDYWYNTVMYKKCG